MLAWVRYHWLVRRRVRRLLRDHVEALAAPPSEHTVIDLTDDVREPTKAPAS